MNAKLVERLARLDPRASSGIVQEAGAFVRVHSDPAFGWNITRAFARARLTFPVTVIGRDHWLFKAYLMHLNPTDRFNPSVLEAYHLSRQPGTSGKLKALLMAALGLPTSPHLNLVAEVTGIHRRTIEAYEILFFNILDRHRDGLYLSSLAYPAGRQVELDEDYFETTPIPDLLLRAAYNHRDFGLVSHLVGQDDASLVKELAALHDGGAEAKLENQIMGNALVIAKAGLLNEQPSAGLQRATALLAAKRPQPDKANDAPGQTPFDMSGELAAALAALPPITDADRREMRAASRPGQSYWHDDAGNIMAFDPPHAVPNSSQSVDCSSDPLVMFPEPVTAIWQNSDADQPVILVGRMSAPGFPDHYLNSNGIGIPVSQVIFDPGQPPSEIRIQLSDTAADAADRTGMGCLLSAS